MTATILEPLTTGELLISAFVIFCAIIALLAVMGGSRQYPPDENE